MTRIGVMMAASVMVTRVAHAGCGLDACPVLEASSVQGDGAPIRVGMADVVRVTGYDIEGQSGTYVENLLGAELVLDPGWFLAARLPFVVLLPQETDTKAGLGNLVVSGEARRGDSERFRWGGGLQVELPTGQAARGVSDDHWALLPYARVSSDLGLPVGVLTVGWLQALGSSHDHGSEDNTGEDDAGHDDHHHDHGHGHEDEGQGSAGSASDGAAHHSPVEPHETSEILVQLTLGADVLNDRLRPEVGIDGQVVMKGTAPGTLFLYTGPGLQSQLSDAWSVRAGVKFPLTKQHRYDWRTAVGVMAVF